MDTSRLIRVNYYPHLFKKGERVIKDVTPKTFSEILKEMEVKWPLENIRILDNDEVVNDIDNIPQSDFVIIKAVPEGEGIDTQNVAYGEKAVGWLSILGGTAAIIAGQAWGASLIGSGLSLVLSGQALLMTDPYSATSSTDAESALSIKGGSNRFSTYSRVPILLGKYLAYPDKCALDYTVESGKQYLEDSTSLPTKRIVDSYGWWQIDFWDNATVKIRLAEDKTSNDYILCKQPSNPDVTLTVKVYKQLDWEIDELVATLSTNESVLISSSWNVTTYSGGDKFPENTATSSVYDNQELHQFFNFGYKEVYVESDTLKIGSVKVSTYNESEAYIDYAIQRGIDWCPTQYNNIVKQLSVGSIVEYGEDTVFNTSSDAVSMYVTLLFSGGLYTLSGSTPVNYPISYSVYYKVADSDDSSYTLLKKETIVGNTKDGFRYVIYGVFDESNEYTVKVIRNTKDDDDDSISDDKHHSVFYVESVRCYTSGADIEPIIPSTKEKLTTLAWAVTASSSLNSNIDDLNAICDLYCLDWNGLGSGSTYWETSTSVVNNPASLVLYVLTNEYITKHPKEDTEIDWEAFEDWWTFCDDNGYTCNNYLKEDTLREDNLIEYICNTGQASFSFIDGLYTIIIDTYKDIKQYFTPRNSWGYTLTKSFPEIPTACNVSFVNEDNEYTQEERLVYFDDDVEDTDVLNEYTVWGITNPTHIYKNAKYLMACMAHRTMTHVFSADMENIVCTRGDRIGFAHDVLQAGIKWGKIKEVLDDGTNITGVIMDEYFILEDGKTYGIVFRLNDGTEESTQLLFSGDQETNEFYFTESISGLTLLEKDNLGLFGYFEEEYVDFIITDIQYGDDFSATITCVDYAPEIFESTSGTIPDFTPNVSLAPSTLGIPLIGYDAIDTNESIIALTEAVELANNNNTTLTGISTPVYNNNTDASDDGIQSGKMAFTGDDSYVYVNYDKGNELYLKTTKTITDGVSITSGITGDCPTYLNDDIMLYVNQSKGSTLYYKNYDEDGEGTQCTTVASWRPRLISTDNILYINFEDENKIYIKYIYDSDNGVLYADISVKDFCFLQNGYFGYIPMGGQGVYVYDVANATSTQISADIVISLDTYDFDTVAYLDVSETRVYTRDCFDGSVETGKPFVDNVNDFAIKDGSIIYSSTDNDSNIFADLSDNLQTLDWMIEPTLDHFTITGEITSGSYVMIVSDVDELDSIAKGDYLTGTGLQNDTYISKISGSNVYLNKSATITVTITVVVQGTRLLIPANKVIIDGSIEADQMSTSAIDSKARTDELTKITEINLDEGTYIFRKQDGTVVLDFDASRTDSEFILSGTLNGADGTFSGTLNGADGTFSGELSGATGTFSGALSAAGGTFNGSLSASQLTNCELDETCARNVKNYTASSETEFLAVLQEMERDGKFIGSSDIGSLNYIQATGTISTDFGTNNLIMVVYKYIESKSRIEYYFNIFDSSTSGKTSILVAHNTGVLGWYADISVVFFDIYV